MRLVSAIYQEHYPFDLLPVVNACVHTTDPGDLQEDDILVTWGGADISPSLYNRPNSGRTWASDRPSRRDEIEWELMKRAKELGVPIIGVCRGAQMLCALAGGFLIQDVENHAGGRHEVSTSEGFTIRVNSIHHQMMYPFDVKHEMLAYTKPLSSYHWDVDGSLSLTVEPEFVYYPEVKGFAIQWHPEMMEVDEPAQTYVLSKIMERL